MNQRYLLLPLLALAAWAQPRPTAGQEYKNIQVLQDLPATELPPAMAFMAASLGVNCGHCHASSRSQEKDDQPAKLAARRMIQLTRAINKEHYKGENVVNCQICHQGRLRPLAMPAISREAPVAPSQDPLPQTPLPTVDQLLERTIDAVGGRAALDKINTRVLEGFLELPGGGRAPLERCQKAPNLLWMQAQVGPNPGLVGYDGKVAWERNATQGSREMEGADRVRTQRDAEFHRELGLRELYRKMTVTGREIAADREAFVVEAASREGGLDKLYFDAQNGLLLRILQISQTPLGPLPFQIDFEDYREVDAVRVPFTVRWKRPGLWLSFRFEHIRHNVPVDEAKFAKPSP